MTEYLEEKDMTKNQLELHDRGFSFDTDGKIVSFNGNFFATYIMEYYHIIYSSDSNFYEYVSGVWCKMDENELKSFLYHELQEPREGVWSTRREKEYLEAMKRLLFQSTEFNKRRHLINMKNGMFDTIRLKLIPHDPKYLSTIQIPVEYDKAAKCPRFDLYLEEVFEGDNERITKASEWYGYCISTETKAQKALVLFGGGGNGKGVYTDILSKIVGDDNLSHVALNELHKSFSRATLFGKTINLSTENEMGGKSLNTQYFKAITGEDTINAEFKNQHVFSFQPTVKMVISMNNLPHTKDRSNGYYRRLDFLLFDRHFSEKDGDPDLKKKLDAELSGIFNLAIRGLVCLRNNGYKFSQCESSDKVIEEYKKELNPIITFFDDALEVADEDHREDNKIVYKAFKRWADNNGHKGYANVSPQRFWREFEAEAKNRKWTTVSGRSNKFRYHTGIKLTEDESSTSQRRKVVKKHVRTNATSQLFDEDED